MDFGDEEPAYSIMGDGVVIRSQVGHDCEIPAIDESEPVKTETPVKEARTESQEIPGVEERAWPFRRTAERETVDISGESVLDYKGGFAEDFKWSIILANTQFRGAKTLFKKLNNYVYDDDYDCYVCMVNLDEDEMYRFLNGTNYACPYYRLDDEYGVVRHQL